MHKQQIDHLRVAEEHLKFLADSHNKTIADAIDTAFTPVRVLYWFHPKAFEFLWTNWGKAGNTSLCILFIGIFITKAYYQEKRHLQITKTSFLKQKLVKRFKQELANESWLNYHFDSFEHFVDFYSETSSYKFSNLLNAFLQPALDLDVNEILASNDFVRLSDFAHIKNEKLRDFIKELFQYKKPLSERIEDKSYTAGALKNALMLRMVEPLFQEKGKVTLKDLLEWLPEQAYQGKGYTLAAAKLGHQLFDAPPKTNKSNNNDGSDTEDEGSTEIDIADELLPWPLRYFRKTKRFISALKQNIWDNALVHVKNFLWDRTNEYTMGYWITRAVATIFIKPNPLDGQLTANTTAIFFLPFIGVGLSIAYSVVKKVRELRDYLFSRNSTDYQPIPDKETKETPESYLDKLSLENKRLLNVLHFEQQLATLLQLKNELQFKMLQKQLKANARQLLRTDKDDLFNHSKQEKDRLATEIARKAGVTAEFTAEQLRDHILAKDRYFAGKKTKIVAAALLSGAGYFAAVSFVGWILLEFLLWKGVNIAMRSLYLTTIGGTKLCLTGTLIDFIFLGLAVGAGIYKGIRVAIETYRTYHEMEQKLQQKEVQKKLATLAAKETELERLKAQLRMAQQIQQEAVNKHNSSISDPKARLNPHDYQMKLSDFVNVKTTDMYSYERFSKTLSFKYSVQTYLKRVGNGGLEILMGGISGSFIARMFLSVLSIGILGTLCATNPVLGVPLLLGMIGLMVSFAAIRFWQNNHLARIKRSQQHYLDMLIPPPGSTETALEHRVDNQIALCKQLLNHCQQNIISLRKTNDLITTAQTPQAKLRPPSVSAANQSIFNRRTQHNKLEQGNCVGAQEHCRKANP